MKLHTVIRNAALTLAAGRITQAQFISLAAKAIKVVLRHTALPPSLAGHLETEMLSDATRLSNATTLSDADRLACPFAFWQQRLLTAHLAANQPTGSTVLYYGPDFRITQRDVDTALREADPEMQPYLNATAWDGD